MRTMSAALTPDLLERITPPPGEVGEAQALEFDTTIQRAVGTCDMADARLVMLVRRALLEGWWRHRGCHSPEHRVTAQLGLDAGRARRVVRIAEELGAYPATAERFAAGLLTEAHVFEIFTEATGIDLDDDDRVDLSGITAVDVVRRLLHAGLAGLDPATAAGQRPSERYQVLVHLDAEHPERTRIHLGPLLGKADRQYLTCDAELRTVLWKDGAPVSVGRLRRTVDREQRVLVEDRDPCCVVCGSTGFLHIHHEIFWEDGGTTDIEWLFAACPTDHKAIHRGDVRVVRDPLDPSVRIFLDRCGRPLPRPGPIPPPGGPPPGEPYRGPDRGRMPRWSIAAGGRRAA